MNIQFEHDYQKKFMTQSFAETTLLQTDKDLGAWRQSWMKALSGWHSPYSVAVDCQNLQIDDTADLTASFERMIKLFNGLFLRKIAGFNYQAALGHDKLPFEVFEKEEEAQAAIGVRAPRQSDSTDFRSQIQIENHFRQHAVEISFSQPVCVDTKEKMQTLRSKLTNNLMQWHSSWNLIIDCRNFSISQDLLKDFDRMEAFFKGVFLKAIVGYNPSVAKDLYPFPSFKARHKAAAMLESEGLFSGEDADCNSRKPNPS